MQHIAETNQVTDLGEQCRTLFDTQVAYQYEVALTSARERKAKLKKLLEAVSVTYRDDIREALHRDFGKCVAEVDLTDIYPVTHRIKHTLRRLRGWIADEHVGTPLGLLGSSSWIRQEPKGVCLIISPWNFPVNLTLGPLVSAIAAGNCVILKPSEHTPHTSALMKKMLANLFDAREIAVVEGGVDVSTALLELPFNHIYFTGAPSIGKIVMGAAARHLSSVTLELGGKSPTIVDETADLKMAVRRIGWGKFLNSGQVCIAPDHLYVHAAVKDELVMLLKEKIKHFYGEHPMMSSDLTKVVNQKHYERIRGYINDAIEKGARILHGGGMDEEARVIEPTLIENIPDDALVAKNEIFGPILPIYTYTHLDELLQKIRLGDKPLAIYVYSKSKRNIETILKNTRAGGTCINHNDVHFFNNNLPFGGSNNSGIGKSHGKWGFEEFSNQRSVLKQFMPGALELLMPPSSGWKQKLIDLTIKWF